MFIRDLKNCGEFLAGDNSILRELFNPLKDNLALNYSLALASVPPGVTTKAHRLNSSEVYYLLKGKGEMRINEEKAEVFSHQAVYIPPNSIQQITNTGEEDLIFLCLVEPAWRPEGEEVLE